MSSFRESGAALKVDLIGETRLRCWRSRSIEVILSKLAKPYIDIPNRAEIHKRSLRAIT